LFNFFQFFLNTYLILIYLIADVFTIAPAEKMEITTNPSSWLQEKLMKIKTEKSEKTVEKIRRCLSKISSSCQKKDSKRLHKKIKKAKKMLGHFDQARIVTVMAEPNAVDEQSQNILSTMRGPRAPVSRYVPVKVGTDGNCFYRTLSKGLTTKEHFHEEFRLRTVCAAVDHHKIIKENMAKRGEQFTGARSYYEELANLASSGEPASAFGITAACVAFDIQIHAVYPQVNGPENKYVQGLGGANGTC
jgi:hypothetical protein